MSKSPAEIGPSPAPGSQVVKRRGVLAAAWAAVAAVALKVTTQPVEAASGPVTMATDGAGSPVNMPASALLIEDGSFTDPDSGPLLLRVASSRTNIPGGLAGFASSSASGAGVVGSTGSGSVLPFLSTRAGVIK